MLKTCKSSYSCKLFVRETNHCNFENEFCPREELVNQCYKRARLTEKQMENVEIREFKNEPDDFALYVKLHEFEQNIGKHVANGDNIYIHSEFCGNGKTVWAIKLLKSYLNIAWKLPNASSECLALFVNVPKFLLDLKNNISNPTDDMELLKEDIINAQLVVWDEVATKSLTEYEHEQLLSFINNRLDNGKSNIYTSNMNENELMEKLGTRLYSRIVGMSEDIHFTGCDKRAWCREMKNNGGNK